MYIKWYDIQPLWLRRKKKKPQQNRGVTKKARYMFTIRFLCTVSKKIKLPSE